MSVLSENLERVSHNIREAAARAGRDPRTIEILAATKTLGMAMAMEAKGAGIALFGENRIQEAIAKYPQNRTGYRLHLIGHLQRNKVKHIPGFFDCVESIDKVETADALNRRCRLDGADVEILFEFNTSGEESKEGFTEMDVLKSALDAVLEMQRVRLRGLMTIGPFTNDRDAIRTSFSSLRQIYDEIRPLVGEAYFDTLSMGMSSDYQVAIEEGATRVRLGTALFGKRNA